MFGALLGLVEAMDGNGEAAARQLRDVVGVLGELAPDDHSVGGTIHFAAAAAWKAGDAEAARRLAPLAERQARHGRSPGPSGSLAHTQARLAAVRGLPSTPELWQQARADAEANGCRPLRLLVDYDEASAVSDRARILDLAPVMAAAGMAGWAALSAAGTPTGQRGGGAGALLPSGLTGREAEVLGLVAGGSSSKEIAVELVLSVLTVNRHIANIYVKIGARNRAEATSFAHRHRLVTPRRD